MMIASRAEPGPTHHTAAMFGAPGRPRPMARRLAIHNRVVRTLRDYFRDAGFHEIPVTALADDPAPVQLDGMLALGFAAVWCESEIMPQGGKLEPRHLRGFKLMEAARSDTTLDQLCALQEQLLKSVAGDMNADLLGGRDVTRLDRMLRANHPRLTYDEALIVLADKGWDLTAGEPLPPQARATLTRHCGNLPYLLTQLPYARVTSDTIDDAHLPVGASVEYVLPYAGVTMEGETRRDADGSSGPDRSGFSLDLGRLLQYLMGLENITDTLIDPMDRIAKVMKDVTPGTGLRRGGSYT